MDVCRTKHLSIRCLLLAIACLGAGCHSVVPAEGDIVLALTTHALAGKGYHGCFNEEWLVQVGNGSKKDLGEFLNADCPGLSRQKIYAFRAGGVGVNNLESLLEFFRTNGYFVYLDTYVAPDGINYTAEEQRKLPEYGKAETLALLRAARTAGDK